MTPPDNFALEEYTGNGTACDHCGKKFHDGQIIAVEKSGEHIFCDCDLFDPSGTNVLQSCAMSWARAQKKIVVAKSMRFNKGMLGIASEIIPESEEKKAKHFDRARKLLEW